jgi:hypothetical protein
MARDSRSSSIPRRGVPSVPGWMSKNRATWQRIGQVTPTDVRGAGARTNQACLLIGLYRGDSMMLNPVGGEAGPLREAMS